MGDFERKNGGLDWQNAFWQFFKYGVIGCMATLVQMGVFYALATSCLACLGPDDIAVKFAGFSAADVADGVRATRFAIATAIGFVVANLFCWCMNRRFVFTPGKFRWYAELGFFFAGSTLATIIALGISAELIHWVGLMTSYAVVIEVVVSFMVNFFTRKFFIFKG